MIEQKHCIRCDEDFQIIRHKDKVTGGSIAGIMIDINGNEVELWECDWCASQD